MTYHVTVRDIARGQRRDCLECPVARAIKRRHHTSYVEVNNYCVKIGTSKYELPLRVWRWIDRFDTGQPVRSMRFELL